MDDDDKSKAPLRENVTKKARQSDVISFVAFDGSSSDANRRAVRKHAALSSAATRKATIAKKIARQKEQRAVDEEETRAVSAKRKKASHSSDGPWQDRMSIILAHPRADDGPSGAHQEGQTSLGPARPDRLIAPKPTKKLMQGADNGEQWLFLDGTWAAASDDYDQIEEMYLPPTPESLASPGTTSASLMDPFNQCPVRYHPVYDRLLHHMMTNFAPRGWVSLKITNEEGIQWERFMTQHALAEPALFLVRCMFASGDMIRLGVLDNNTVVALRGLAIKAINEALSDDTRSISDGLILAVGRIAFAESLYGDREAASIMHRPAQRRMIDLRGGMAALGFPPLIKRLMRLTDRIMSIQSGTARLLPDNEEVGRNYYDMKSTVNVLEDWAPQEARSLRKKIAIADLITPEDAITHRSTGP